MRIADVAFARGVVRATVGCPGTEVRCFGSHSLRSAGRVAVARGERRRRVLFDRARFTAVGGRSAALEIRLSRSERRLLARAGRIRVVLAVRLRDVAGNVARGRTTFTLRAPRRARR